jgi:hypothetical protein
LASIKDGRAGGLGACWISDEGDVMETSAVVERSDLSTARDIIVGEIKGVNGELGGEVGRMDSEAGVEEADVELKLLSTSVAVEILVIVSDI